jgi:hypothetical protein
VRFLTVVCDFKTLGVYQMILPAVCGAVLGGKLADPKVVFVTFLCGTTTRILQHVVQFHPVHVSI